MAAKQPSGVAVGQDDSANVLFRQPDHVAVISGQVAAVVDDRYSVGGVDHQAHAVNLVFANMNLGHTALEQRFLGDIGFVPSASLPSASSMETYFNMSRTLLHAPPAGRKGMTASLMAVIALAGFPSTSGECAVAWLFASARPGSKVVAFIWSGSNTYDCMARS